MEVPEKYRPISAYYKTGIEYKNRDVVIYYWTLYYVAQQAMKLGKEGEDSIKFLMHVLDTLETIKKEHPGVEAVTQDVVAQAHIEAQALKLFNYADKNDREGVFNKNVVKAFYAAGQLFDILTLFGELDDGVASARKYSKWKATYIHGCLKRGETPMAGPPEREGEDSEIVNAFDNLIMKKPTDPAPSHFDRPVDIPQPPPRSIPPPTNSSSDPRITPDSTGQSFGWNQNPHQPQGHQGLPQNTHSYPGFSTGPGQQFPGHQPGYNSQPTTFPPHPTFPNESQQPGTPHSTPYSISQAPSQPSFPNPYSVPNPPPQVKEAHKGDNVTLEEYIESRRLCKMAASALDYEDAKTAIDFLEKALAVLKK